LQKLLPIAKRPSLWMQRIILSPHPWLVLTVHWTTWLQAVQDKNFWFLLSTSTQVVEYSVNSLRQQWWNFLIQTFHSSLLKFSLSPAFWLLKPTHNIIPLLPLLLKWDTTFSL